MPTSSQNISVQRESYSSGGPSPRGQVVRQHQEDGVDHMRNRFETDMRNAEREMNRLRGEMESRPGGGGPQHHHHAIVQSDPSRGMPRPQSNVVKDESDPNTMRIRFDVCQYRPEEITVKTVDDRLIVQAKHEEKDGGRSVYREFNQDFTLPAGVRSETVTSTLGRNGILTVEAPLPTKAIEQGPGRF